MTNMKHDITGPDDDQIAHRAESLPKYTLSVHESSVGGDKMLMGVAFWVNY